jgi:hypothetical protein
MLLLLLVLLAVPAYAQTGGTGDPGSGEAQAQSAPEPENDEPKSTEAVTVDPFGDEVSSRMRFSGSLDYRYEYDDNVFSTSAGQLSDNISNLSGRFSVAVRKKRSAFQLHYAPSYRAYYEFDQRNAFSQALTNSIDHAFTGRTSLSWNASLSDRSNGSNSGVSFENVGGVIVPVFHQNGLQSDARVLSSRATLGLAHRFSARSTLQLALNGGTTNFLAEDSVPLISGRSDEQFSVGASARWDYQVRRGRFFGVSVSQQYLGFLAPAGHLNYQQAQLTFRQEFRNGFRIRLGAGPSFTQNSQAGGRSDSTSYSIDAGVERVRLGTRLAVGYTRGVSLGSLQSSVVSDAVTASYARDFLRRWRAGTSIAYSRSQSVIGTARNLESVGVSATAGYKLSRDIEINARFSHLNQFGDSGAIFNSNFDRNTFSIGVSYRFGTERGK